MEPIDFHKNWYAVYTKPRSEKKVEERLQSIGVECYCPVQKVLKQWSDRKKMVSQPLFTSYVFVNVPEFETSKVLTVVGVVGYVYWLGKPAVIPECEILDLKAFLAEYSEIDVDIIINPGDNVMVNSGPLKNYQGIVVDTKRNSAILRLESIGYQLLAEVNKNRITVVI